MSKKITPKKITQAAHYLQSGGLVVFPTDTVYGIAVNPYNQNSIAKLYRIKNRPDHKVLPLLVESFEQAEKIAYLSETARQLAKAFWPGALTMIVTARDTQLKTIADDGTIAIRYPNHPITCQIIHESGMALGVSSANKSGEPPAYHAQQIEAFLNKKDVMVLLDGDDHREEGIASTVVDIKNHRLPRIGSVSRMAIEKVVGKSFA